MYYIEVIPSLSGVGLVAILCSILSTYLLSTTTYSTASQHKKVLFDIALKTITSLGSTHTEQFRTVIASSLILKSSIEQAVVLNQANQAAELQRQEEANKRRQLANTPAIQLKMKFGNFT